MKVYVLTTNFVLDYEEEWEPTRVFHHNNKAAALAAFKEIRDAWYKNWVQESEWEVDADDETYFCAYDRDSYAQNHCSVSLETIEVE